METFPELSKALEKIKNLFQEISTFQESSDTGSSIITEIQTPFRSPFTGKFITLYVEKITLYEDLPAVENVDAFFISDRGKKKDYFPDYWDEIPAIDNIINDLHILYDVSPYYEEFVMSTTNPDEISDGIIKLSMFILHLSTMAAIHDMNTNPQD